jgi:GntR family transcriptional regulator/MocR family aminotransferase
LGIIDWAKRTDSYIIEDDYDSELRYNSHPIQSLQSLDGGNRVIYLGTFSKSLSPDLRIAYLVLPEKLLSTYNEKYKVSNSNVPTLIQEALAEYIESGEYENGLRAIRTFYKRKHDYILEHLKRDDIELLGTEAGLHFLMNINTNLNRTQIMQIMEKYGIGIYSTERYWILHEKCAENQILVGFSSIPSIDLEKAMISFNNALDEITR